MQAQERNRDFTVTVCVFVYNHEHIVHRSLDSILNQKTDFNVEILIGEDGSTDGTPAVLERYRSEHPGKIHILYQDQSKKIYLNGRPSGRYNLMNSILNAKGKYIALLDGDDYWIDEHKLQKQVDILENNPDCVLCASNCYQGNFDTLFNRKDRLKIKEGQKLSERDIISDIVPYHTSTLVFRSVITGFPDWFRLVMSGDYPLFFLLIRHGKFIAIEDVCSFYTINEISVTSARRSDRFRNEMEYISLLKIINKYTGHKYNRKFSELIFKHYTIACYTSIKSKDFKLARKTFYKAIVTDFRKVFGRPKFLLSLFIQSHFNFLYSGLKQKKVNPS